MIIMGSNITLAVVPTTENLQYCIYIKSNLVPRENHSPGLPKVSDPSLTWNFQMKRSALGLQAVLLTNLHFGCIDLLYR
jgi:hypothetical protein